MGNFFIVCTITFLYFTFSSSLTRVPLPNGLVVVKLATKLSGPFLLLLLSMKLFFFLPSYSFQSEPSGKVLFFITYFFPFARATKRCISFYPRVFEYIYLSNYRKHKRERERARQGKREGESCMCTEKSVSAREAEK